MHTERTMVPAARDALLAACPVVREGVPASDAIAGVVPSFVAFPASTDEASALLRVAAERRLAVVARGAGTGLGWGAPPTSADLVIDLQAMDQVLEHAAGDLVARVQAGVTMGHLASVLASAGQELALKQGYIPADPQIALPAGFPDRKDIKLMDFDPARALADAKDNTRRFVDIFGP